MLNKKYNYYKENDVSFILFINISNTNKAIKEPMVNPKMKLINTPLTSKLNTIQKDMSATTNINSSTMVNIKDKIPLSIPWNVIAHISHIEVTIKNTDTTLKS